LLRRFTPPVMLHRIDWSIISAFRRAEGSSYSGVKQSKNTEQMHPYDKGTATVRNFDNNVYLQDYTAYYPIRLESSEKPFWQPQNSRTDYLTRLFSLVLLGRLKTARHSDNRP